MTLIRTSTSRRAFLRTLRTAAGAAVLAPFYAQLARAEAPSPRRFVFIVEGNGFEPVTMLSQAARDAYNAANPARVLTAADRFWPGGYRHDGVVSVDGDLSTAPALGALTHLDPTLDLRTEAAVLMGLSSRITGGGHSTQHGTLSSTRTSSNKAGGETIDAFLARSGSIPTPLSAFRVGVQPGQTVMFNVCAFGKQKPAPMFVDPKAAYSTLFSSVGSAEDRANFTNRRRVLDFANADVREAINRFSGSSIERQKLERYLTSVEEMSRRHTEFQDLESTLERVKPEDPSTNPLYQAGGAGVDVLDQFRAQLQLVAAALQGGITHVAVVAMGPGGGLGMTYESVLSGVDRHNLHHGSAGDPQFLAAIHEVTRLQVAAIAGLARTLKQTPGTAAPTMLDETAIVFIGDNGEQHHSTATDFPTLVLGGRALGLQLDGKTHLYPGVGKDNHRQVSNLWNTMGYAAGLALDDFGGEGRSRVAAGPLSEIFR